MSIIRYNVKDVKEGILAEKGKKNDLFMKPMKNR